MRLIEFIKENWEQMLIIILYISVVVAIGYMIIRISNVGLKEVVMSIWEGGNK